MTNQQFAVFASLQLSLLYQCEAHQIQGDLDSRVLPEKGKKKKATI